MQAVREYEVVRDGNAFGAGLSNSVVYLSEYEQARRYLAMLLSQYQGITVGEQFRGEEIVNDGGTCFSLEYRQDLRCPSFDPDHFRQDLRNDLTLVHGIGPVTRKKLNARGYRTIPDLLEDPGLRSRAHRVLACLSEGKSSEIMDMISSRHAKSHALVLGAAVLHEPEDYVFVDIETLGLFSRPIILFGVGVIDHGQIVVRQFLLRDIAEEQAALAATVGHLSGDCPALVTFNGKSFDLPYITDRLAYYGMAPPARIPHFDILHFSRRRWKDQLPSLRLAALEREILGVCRNDDIPGQMVPEFYETYLRTGNIGPLVPIVEHNRQDVISLALLFFHLLEEKYGGQ
jgi:uncharacterized protein YprB with RNaseH-like and TPR domain